MTHPTLLLTWRPEKRRAGVHGALRQARGASSPGNPTLRDAGLTDNLAPVGVSDRGYRAWGCVMLVGTDNSTDEVSVGRVALACGHYSHLAVRQVITSSSPATTRS